MKKSARACIIMQILTEHPNTDFPLSYFAESFECAKSSISEDIKVVKEAVELTGTGRIVTSIGARGGVRFIPCVSEEKALAFLKNAKERFEEKDRLLGSGFLFTSDVMFDPQFAKGAGAIFANRFADMGADLVVTVETKGIAVAEYTAQYLGVPLSVIRRESKVSDGSTVSINYFSGSSDRIQKMSLPKREISPGSRAIIIDDFARGGGSINGICDMLAEFDCEALAAGVVLAVDGAKHSRVEEFVPLLLIDSSWLIKEGKFVLSINKALLKGDN